MKPVVGLALMIFMLGSACAKPAPSSRAGAAMPDDWRKRTAKMLETKDCAGAIAYLNTVRTREPLWYELASQAHIACWKQRSSSADGTAAVEILNQGLTQYPRSANLLLSRGYRHQELGLREAALDDYKAAELLARENLARDTPEQQAVDRAVLQSATQASTQLRDPGVTAAIEEQDLLTLLSSGKCEAAISHLKTVDPRLRTDVWYDSVFTANSFCLNERANQAYRQAAESALEEGLRRFPSSFKLLADCGAWNQAAGRTGDSAIAARAFEQ